MISPFAFRNRRRSQLAAPPATHTHTPVGNYNTSNNDCRLWRESRTPFVVIIVQFVRRTHVMTLSTPACPALVRRSTRRAHVVAVSHARYTTSEDPRPPLSFRVRFIIYFFFQFRFNNNFILPSRVVRSSLVLHAVPLIIISSSYYFERNLNRLYELYDVVLFLIFSHWAPLLSIKKKKKNKLFISTDTLVVCVSSVVSSRVTIFS
ncbi:unnamed protein product [Aphis gossypii]|uniref:Uncharacterized protein n=1 Tax=Aphis gossypii TaxID=80765 RepID=A0A9P0J9G2_APHGO|nr:unnamed protein product [Aphis gossypii]